MSVSDLTGYTWTGYESSFFERSQTFNINFYLLADSSTSYTQLRLYMNDDDFPVEFLFDLYYNSTRVYTCNESSYSWANSQYKSIVFTGGVDATNSDLISLLETIGTLTAPQPTTHTVTIDGTAYTIDDNTSLLVNATGLYNSTTSSQVWTYSGDTKFLGFATSSGGSIVYDINDTITLTSDLTLYSVEQERLPLYINNVRTDKYNNKVINKIGDYYVARYEYSITTSVTNGTSSGATSILADNGTATVTVSADSGYDLPTITQSNVTNATLSNVSGGVLTLSNPTGDVTINVVCEAQGPASYTVTFNLSSNVMGGTEQTVKIKKDSAPTSENDYDYIVRTTSSSTPVQNTLPSGSVTVTALYIWATGVDTFVGTPGYGWGGPSYLNKQVTVTTYSTANQVDFTETIGGATFNGTIYLRMSYED